MGDSVENFDGYEVADIRRIALSVMGGKPESTPGGRAPVKGVAETRARFEAQKGKLEEIRPLGVTARQKVESLKARHLQTLVRYGAATQLTPDRPGSLRLDFLSLSRRVSKLPLLGRAEITKMQEWIGATGRAGLIGIKGAALAAAWSFIPEPLGGIAQAGIVGGVMAGPVGAVAFAGVAATKGTLTFMGRRAMEEEAARARTRGYRSPEARIEQHGLAMRIALLEAKISGIISGIQREWEVDPKGKVKEWFTYEYLGDWDDPDSGRRLGAIRFQRERDIAEWKQQPINDHPGAQWALQQMQADLEDQLLGVMNLANPGQRFPQGRVEVLMNRAGLTYDGVKSPATTGS